MTRKDYALIAVALLRVRPDGGLERQNALDIWKDVRDSVASALERDNPRFDRNKFIGATQQDYRCDAVEQVYATQEARWQQEWRD